MTAIYLYLFLSPSRLFLLFFFISLSSSGTYSEQEETVWQRLLNYTVEIEFGVTVHALLFVSRY